MEEALVIISYFCRTLLGSRVGIFHGLAQQQSYQRDCASYGLTCLHVSSHRHQMYYYFCLRLQQDRMGV